MKLKTQTDGLYGAEVVAQMVERSRFESSHWQKIIFIIYFQLY